MKTPKNKIISLAGSTISQFFSSQQKHILILFLNNNENRPGGGFITNALLLTIGKWRLKHRFLDVFFELKNSKIKAPEEVTRYLGHKKLPFRDALIYPFLDENIQNLKSILKTNKLPSPKKVILINTTAAESVWQELKLEPKNLFFHLTVESSTLDFHNLEQLQKRKQVIHNFYFRLIKASILRFWKWPALIRLLNQELLNKNLQIYPSSLDTNLRSNFLGVFDCNYLGIKNNRYISKNIQHHINIEPKQTRQKLLITLDHRGSFNYPLSGYYQGTLKIILPKKAKFQLQTPLQYRTYQQEKYQEISIYILMEPKDHLEINLEYTLPACKKLDFQYLHQPGANNNHFSQTINTSPQFFLDPHPFFSTRENSAISSQLPQIQDLHYQLTWQNQKMPPRIYFHEIIQPNLVLLKFNEPVKFKKNSFKISNQKQAILIKNIKTSDDKTRIWLKTEAFPRQENQFYTIKIDGLHNQQGTELNSKQRQVTIVYRSKKFKL